MKPRVCGPCQLCCKLLPISEFGKLSGVRCQHQRFRKGCAIYQGRPESCEYWQCGWLSDPLAASLRRPDLAGYVIDPSPEYVEIATEDGEMFQFPSLQIWGDSGRPDAHRDPELRKYLIAKNEQDGYMPIVRFGSDGGNAVALVPPSHTANKEWLEKRTTSAGREHSASEIFEVLSSGPSESR